MSEGVRVVLRRLIILFLLLLLFSALAEAFLPRTVQRGLEVGLGNMLGGDPEVGLRSFPALKLLLGRFDQITVESYGVKAGTLLIDTLSASLEDVAVNLRALLMDRTLVVERVGRQTVRLRLSEESLRRHVAATVKTLEDPEVALRDGVASFRGRIAFGQQSFRLEVDGIFTVPPEDPSRVTYLIQGLRFDGIGVEAPFLPKLVEMLGGPDTFIDLNRFPLPLRATEVTVADGWLVIEAQVAE